MLALYCLLGILILMILLFLAVQFFNMLFRGYAPFLSTKPKVLEAIFKEINLEKNFSGRVYELGCGRAGFLDGFGQHFPQAKLTGFEYSFLPYLLARIQNSFRKTKIKIIKKNIFKVDLSQADLVYCYLNPETMARLEPKFKKEMKPTARIISYGFKIPNQQSEKETSVNGKDSKIYFYKLSA